jgi:hypothetical protein
MPKPSMNSTAPGGWTNVAPSDLTSLTTCANLIMNSTSTSGVNGNTNPKTLQNNIQKGRTALWLKNDGLVTVVFHSLDGPTNSAVGTRTPKFVVCAGVDPSAPPFDSTNGGGDTYKWMRGAVKFFANDDGNQNTARLYFLFERNKPLMTGDRIKPFYDYAVLHELDSSENTAGAPEDYTTAQVGHVRWPNSLTTYLIKLL